MQSDETKSNPRPKRISILGATGTIGKNTLELILNNPDAYEVIALTGNQNIQELAAQAQATNAKFVATASNEYYQDLKAALSHTDIEIAAGKRGILEAASFETDLVMAAIVGVAGLEPTLKTLSTTQTLALANKECLVSAGQLFLQEAEKHNTTIIPVDSEHSATYQCLAGEDIGSIDKIILTASGGPFRLLSKSELKTVTKKQALKHPNWRMGAKISIDSATMMNKGLELIEAKYLFNLNDNQIDTIVHPQSIIHCLVQFEDGSTIAHLSEPDMKIPIAFSLGWPDRIPSLKKPIDLTKFNNLTFEPADEERFPCLRIAKEILPDACQRGAILNAANEVAVDAFLTEKCTFTHIAGIIENTLDQLEKNIQEYNHLNLEDILRLDAKARQISHSSLLTTN